MQDKERFTLRMPTKLYQTLGEVATAEGISLNTKILQILWDWIRKQEKDAG